MKNKPRKSIFDIEQNVNLDEFTKPYQTFKEELKDHLYFVRNRLNHKEAYLVTCKDVPDIFCITFVSNKDQAKNVAFKYFSNELLHPKFIGEGKYDMFVRLQRNRCKEFDEYAQEGKVPVAKLLKIGVSIPCALCHKHIFTEDDYEKHRCFVIEGEGDLNSFTKGIMVCYNCKRKLEG